MFDIPWTAVDSDARPAVAPSAAARGEHGAGVAVPDGVPSSPAGTDVPLTREQTVEAESLTDLQDEEDPAGYGFGV